MLLGGISAAVVLVGSRWGWPGATAALGVAVAFNVAVRRRAATVALRAMRAYPVGEAEQPVLCRVVRELTVRARTPMPRIYVSPTPAVNAFAAGGRPGRACVCCTEGMLALLDERELRAVIGHEIAHIRRGDAITSSAAAAVASLVMISGRRGPCRFLLLALGPLAAGVVRLAANPAREYQADAEAARLTGDPLALASALRKIDASVRRLVLPPERDIVAASHAMIASPLRHAGVARLFASHPPMAERVARLEQRAGYRR